MACCENASMPSLQTTSIRRPPIMMRNRLWVVFALVLAWHAAIFIFTQQPVPANDAFFYDGAVIHHLLHGGYYNPCVAPGFPISGTEVFSAYPPLYQLPLLGWMSIFGVSALSAIAFHLCLFGLYALVMFAVFYRLRTPPWCVNTRPCCSWASRFVIGLIASRTCSACWRFTPVFARERPWGDFRRSRRGFGSG